MKDKSSLQFPYDLIGFVNLWWWVHWRRAKMSPITYSCKEKEIFSRHIKKKIIWTKNKICARKVLQKSMVAVETNQKIIKYAQIILSKIDLEKEKHCWFSCNWVYSFESQWKGIKHTKLVAPHYMKLYICWVAYIYDVICVCVVASDWLQYYIWQRHNKWKVLWLHVRDRMRDVLDQLTDWKQKLFVLQLFRVEARERPCAWSALPLSLLRICSLSPAHHLY